MGHQALQRVSMRMLFDPKFAAQVYAAPEESLASLDITSEERGWLLDVDPRAWTVDHERGPRTLRKLFDEFKGSTTLALNQTRSLASLRGFFESAHFHEAVQQRGSLAQGYARFLGELSSDPLVAQVASLEWMQARCRRELELCPRLHGMQTDWVARAAGVDAGEFDGATLDALNSAEQALFALNLVPAAGLADDAPRPRAVQPAPQAPLHLVARPIDGQVRLVSLGRMACLALMALEHPMPVGEAQARISALGLGMERAGGLLSGLIQEGLVQT
jgi:hypothetical protein